MICVCVCKCVCVCVCVCMLARKIAEGGMSDDDDGLDEMMQQYDASIKKKKLAVSKKIGEKKRSSCIICSRPPRMPEIGKEHPSMMYNKCKIYTCVRAKQWRVLPRPDIYPNDVKFSWGESPTKKWQELIQYVKHTKIPKTWFKRAKR